MEFLNRMTEVINYIEEHVTDDFNLTDVAKIVCCDVYQFGRIFSYVVGISLAEYIRNRRLSLAALELQNGNVKVIDIALKYGYSSPESFARAFREMHGVSPKEAFAKGVTLRMYPCIDFQITIKGVVNMDYRIEEISTIKCVGVSYTVVQAKDVWTNAWEKFIDIPDEKLGGSPDQILACKHHLYRAPLWQIGLAHNLENGDLVLSIGAEDAGGEYPGFDYFEIPAGTWAKFKGNGTMPSGIGALYTKIFTEWLPSSGYEQSMKTSIEIYPPGDSQSEEYTFEVWLPIKKK